MNVGVYSVQGDVYENIAALEMANTEHHVQKVAGFEQISKIDAIVLPGGESTVMGKMGDHDGSLRAIKQRALDGMPVLGICAGMVLLAKQATDKSAGTTGQPLLGLLDMQVERNSFGRQSNSFEANVEMSALGIQNLKAAFIRAPSVLATGPDVQTLAKYEQKIVAVRSGKIMALAFHPELGSDVSIYEKFLETI